MPLCNRSSQFWPAIFALIFIVESVLYSHSCRSCRMVDTETLECSCNKADGTTIVSSLRCERRKSIQPRMIDCSFFARVSPSSRQDCSTYPILLVPRKCCRSQLALAFAAAHRFLTAISSAFCSTAGCDAVENSDGSLKCGGAGGPAPAGEEAVRSFYEEEEAAAAAASAAQRAGEL